MASKPDKNKKIRELESLISYYERTSGAIEKVSEALGSPINHYTQKIGREMSARMRLQKDVDMLTKENTKLKAYNKQLKVTCKKLNWELKVASK